MQPDPWLTKYFMGEEEEAVTNPIYAGGGPKEGETVSGWEDLAGDPDIKEGDKVLLCRHRQIKGGGFNWSGREGQLRETLVGATAIVVENKGDERETHLGYLELDIKMPETGKLIWWRTRDVIRLWPSPHRKCECGTTHSVPKLTPYKRAGDFCRYCHAKPPSIMFENSVKDIQAIEDEEFMEHCQKAVDDINREAENRKFMEAAREYVDKKLKDGAFQNSVLGVPLPIDPLYSMTDAKVTKESYDKTRRLWFDLKKEGKISELTFLSGLGLPMREHFVEGKFPEGVSMGCGKPAHCSMCEALERAGAKVESHIQDSIVCSVEEKNKQKILREMQRSSAMPAYQEGLEFKVIKERTKANENGDLWGEPLTMQHLRDAFEHINKEPLRTPAIGRDQDELRENLNWVAEKTKRKPCLRQYGEPAEGFDCLSCDESSYCQRYTPRMDAKKAEKIRREMKLASFGTAYGFADRHPTKSAMGSLVRMWIDGITNQMKEAERQRYQLSSLARAAVGYGKDAADYSQMELRIATEIQRYVEGAGMSADEALRATADAIYGGQAVDLKTVKPESYPGVEVKETTRLINWLHPVSTTQDLPCDAKQGDACYVESMQNAYFNDGKTWLPICGPMGQRTKLVPCGIQSGRISSKEPNLQELPRSEEEKMRALGRVLTDQFVDELQRSGISGRIREKQREEYKLRRRFERYTTSILKEYMQDELGFGIFMDDWDKDACINELIRISDDQSPHATMMDKWFRARGQKKANDFGYHGTGLAPQDVDFDSLAATRSRGFPVFEGVPDEPKVIIDSLNAMEPEQFTGETDGDVKGAKENWLHHDLKETRAHEAYEGSRQRIKDQIEDLKEMLSDLGPEEDQIGGQINLRGWLDRPMGVPHNIPTKHKVKL